MMIKTKSILAIIPARGGSKGLPNKNIINLAGKPLIAWTIEASIKSQYITDVVVSSDSDEVLSIAEKFGAISLKRPTKYATDEASSEVVIAHAIEEMGSTYDYVILLQPTSPLRDCDDIDKAVEKFFSTRASSLISVLPIDNKILKSFTENADGYLQGIKNNSYPFMRRQDLPNTYISNGAIYIVTIDEFIKNNSFFSQKTVSYVMSEKKSMDIDTRDDLDIVEKFLETKR